MPVIADNIPLEERTFFVRAGAHDLQVMTLAHPGTPKDGAATLVFLHEGLGSIVQWRDFPRLLASATGLGALVYDRYGFGGSDPLQETRDGQYLQREAHETLPQVLESCGVDRPVLVGHSDGGTIALLYAARFPEQLRGVITEAAHVFIEEITLAGIRGAVTAFESGGLRGKLARYHGERTESMFRGWSDTWLAPEFREWSMEEYLAEIRSPVLAIQGTDDEYGTAAQVHAIAGGVSGRSDFRLIPGCGHIPHQQAQEQVLREMTRFVEGLK